ncbi:MAG: hypothetical protein WC718_04550 [Phycisphaerales bacterium]
MGITTLSWRWDARLPGRHGGDFAAVFESLHLVLEGLVWRVESNGEWVGAGADELDSRATDATALETPDLARLLRGIDQVIDGSFVGSDSGGERVVRLSIIDNSWLDMTTKDPKLIGGFLQHFGTPDREGSETEV